MEKEIVYTYEDQRVERPATPINMSKNGRRLSLIGGSLLTAVALVRRGWSGLGLGALAGGLLIHGTTGFSMLNRLLGRNRAVISSTAAVSVPHEQGIRVEGSMTINYPVEALYDFWRDFTNLPMFMDNLKSVTVESPTRSHWAVNGPAGTTIEWDAEIVNDIPNQVIAWRTLDNRLVSHAGSVHFRPATRNRGTEVHVEMEYAPMGGPVAALVAKLFRQDPKQQITEDLRRLKRWLETGEIITVEGQSSGREQDE